MSAVNKKYRDTPSAIYLDSMAKAFEGDLESASQQMASLLNRENIKMLEILIHHMLFWIRIFKCEFAEGEMTQFRN